MSVMPQVPGQALAQQPAQSFIDMFPKTANFNSEINERQNSLDIANNAFKNYFGRIHKIYKSMDTTNIENLVNRFLQDPDSPLMNFVKKETLLKDTFKNRYF